MLQPGPVLAAVSLGVAALCFCGLGHGNTFRTKAYVAEHECPGLRVSDYDSWHEDYRCETLADGSWVTIRRVKAYS